MIVVIYTYIHVLPEKRGISEVMVSIPVSIDAHTIKALLVARIILHDSGSLLCKSPFRIFIAATKLSCHDARKERRLQESIVQAKIMIHAEHENNEKSTIR